jgi:hypothetical protein
LLSASQAGRMLRGTRTMGPVEWERKRIALELVGDVHRFDNRLLAINRRIAEAVRSMSAVAASEIEDWVSSRSSKR